MKTCRTPILLAAWLLASVAGHGALAATLIIEDQYDAANTDSGFALGSGVNSGINPPATRLTGVDPAGLRYIRIAGSTKAASAHYITNDAKLAVAPATSSSTISLSTGTGAFDFGPSLNTASQTPATPGVYDLTINMANATAAANNYRFSFAFGSAAGNTAAWDFGIQLYHANAADSAYTLQKRIRKAASGTGTDLNLPIGLVGTYPNEVAFLIRVTDAGAESGANYHSRVQVSVDGGSTWIYDTATDPDLPNAAIRFSGLGRYVSWDIAPNAGPVTYDNFSLTWNSGPGSAPRVWTGGSSSDSNWSTAANWNEVVPVSGDSLIFEGTARQANVNDLTGLSITSLTFNNGGFNLSGNPLLNVGVITNLSGVNTIDLEMNWPSSGAAWNLSPGSELVLNNNYSVEFATGDHSLNGGGALRLNGTMTFGQVNSSLFAAFSVNDGKFIVDGGSFSTRGGFRVGSAAASLTAPEVVLIDGASLAITTPASNVRLGDSTNPLGAVLTMDNSTLTMSGGSLAIPYAEGATGVVNQIGGLVAGGKVNFSQGGAGMGTYNLTNGTLEAIQILKSSPQGVAQINFDNAVLRTAAGASNSAFMSGLDVAQINAGGLTLDISTTDVEIGQPLTGAGGLTKMGFNTATLTGTNTFAGNILVSQGALVLPSVQTNAAAIHVADAATLGILVQSPGTTLTAGSLTFGDSSSSSVSFDFSNYNPTAPAVRVSSLSANGPVTVNVTHGPYLNIGTIVLIDYTGVIGGGGFGSFTIGSLPPGMEASLVNNTANGSIDLNITSVPGLKWAGAESSDWDYSTLNWVDGAGAPTTFNDGYLTKFLDDASTGLINIAGFPTPSTILVSNTALPYVMSGGALTTSLLVKKGDGALTRVDGEADFIDQIELDQGSLVINNTYDSAFTTPLIDDGNGQGTLVIDGPSTLTASVANPGYNGNFLVVQGTLKPTAAQWFGTADGITIITNGGTLDLNNLNLGNEPVVVSGAGINGQGAIIDSTTDTGVLLDLKNVTLTGDTVFGVPNGGRWDLRVNAATGVGPGLTGNGFNLTKRGPGIVSIASDRNLGAETPYWRMNLGDISVSEGTLAFAQSLDLGNPSKQLTVSEGATLQFYDLGLTNPIARNISMTNATLAAHGGGISAYNIFNGSVEINGLNKFDINRANLVLNGPLTGSGSIVLTALTTPAILALNGTNTTGDVTVNSGRITGTGVIAGNLIMLGGTCAPGYGGVGSLTVNGDVTLSGATVMELNRGLTPNSDRLVVGGNLVFGGVLQVVLGAGAPLPRANDIYHLFSKGGSGAFTEITLPNISALPGELSWNTDKLISDGYISVEGSAASPVISSVSGDGGNFSFSGAGGIPGETYYVVGSTNVATPVTDWAPVATNVFGAGGAFGYTNNAPTNIPAFFYRIKLP